VEKYFRIVLIISPIQEHVIKLPDKAEADRFFNYPYAAIEESLCNAVYHKGYDVREPIEVRVLPDRIEIVSHPGADRSITEQGLKTYHVFNRRYRNRRIGEFLKEMHLTEGRNTGFKKILNALKRNGSPDPIFETDPERLSFSSTLLIHPYFILQNEGENEGENKEITKNERMILTAIEKEPSISVAKMVKELGLSKASLERAIKSLKEKHFIKRQGPAKGGKWIILKNFCDIIKPQPFHIDIPGSFRIIPVPHFVKTIFLLRIIHISAPSISYNGMIVVTAPRLPPDINQNRVSCINLAAGGFPRKK
jgi:ATP-dependent DNA helicase RecG